MDDLRVLKEIKKYRKGEYKLLSDLVAGERSLEIQINSQRIVSIACLPQQLPELALGFLFSEGLLKNLSEMINCEFSPEELWIDFELNIPAERIEAFQTTGEKTSGCGSTLSSAISGSREKFSPVEFSPQDVLAAMQRFQKDSELFLQTGGVHRAGLVKAGKIIHAADDIGRHNAVDKAAGMALLKGDKLKDHILICSGRISSEIVKKAVRLGIPMVVSHSAATSEAIRLGWKYKVYLIGFARGERFNIYTGFEEKIFG